MSRALQSGRIRYMPPWPDHQLNSTTPDFYDWQNNVMYYDGDTVRYNNQNWYCMYDHLSTLPPDEDSVKWRKLTYTRFNPENAQITPYLPSSVTSTQQTSRRAFWPTRPQ